MDRTTPSIADLTTTHAAGWYISAGPDGTEYGRGRTATDALLMAAERLDAPRYDLMLDVCAGDPEELEGPSEEGGEGGPNPDADPYISALAAHVAREYTAFLAAAPDSPAPSFHQPAPAGGDAASAAGPNRYRAHGCVVTWYGGRAADFRVRLVKRCDTPERARRIAATLNAFRSGPTAKAVA